MFAPAAAPLYTVHWPVACTRTFPPVSPSVTTVSQLLVSPGASWPTCPLLDPGVQMSPGSCTPGPAAAMLQHSHLASGILQSNGKQWRLPTTMNVQECGQNTHSILSWLSTVQLAIENMNMSIPGPSNKLDQMSMFQYRYLYKVYIQLLTFLHFYLKLKNLSTKLSNEPLYPEPEPAQ